MMLTYLDTEVKFYENKASFTDTRHLNKYNKEVDAYIQKSIHINEIIFEPSKIDKRTRRGKKQASLPTDITPAYLKRKEPLSMIIYEKLILYINYLLINLYHNLLKMN